MVKIMYHGITPWYNMLYHGMVLPWYFSSRGALGGLAGSNVHSVCGSVFTPPCGWS